MSRFRDFKSTRFGFLFAGLFFAQLPASVAADYPFPIDFSVGCKELVAVPKNSQALEVRLDRAVQQLRNFTSRIESAKISADGDYAVVQMNDPGRPKLLFLLEPKFNTQAKVVGEVWATSSDLKAALVFTTDRKAQLWNLTSFSPPASVTFPKVGSEMKGRESLLRVRRDFSQFAIHTSADITYIWNGRTETLSLAAMSEGPLVLVARDRFIVVADFESGTQIRSLVGHREKVRFLQTRRDFTRAISASDDGTARAWDLTTGRQLAEYPIGNYKDVESITPAVDLKSVRISFRNRAAATWEIP